MKIRLKFNKNVSILECPETNPTFSELIQRIAESLKITSARNQILISLNNSDFFSNEENCSQGIKELGIINGDTLFVKKIHLFEDIKAINTNEIFHCVNSEWVNSGLDGTSSTLQKIVVPLHVFLQDCGFKLDTNLNESLAAVFKSQSNTIRVFYVYGPCPGAKVSLTIYPAGRFLCIAGGVINNNSRHQAYIVPSKFVSSGSDVNSSPFQNLTDLSIYVKNCVFIPIKVDVHQAFNTNLSSCLVNLPYPAMTLVLDYLDVRSLCCLMRTCSTMHQTIKSCEHVWLGHMKSLFPAQADSGPDSQPENDVSTYERYRRKRSHPSYRINSRHYRLA